MNATGAAALTVQNGSRELIYDPYAGAGLPNGYLSYPYLYPHARATIIVGEQGVISGDGGIWIERSSSNYLGNSEPAGFAERGSLLRRKQRIRRSEQRAERDRGLQAALLKDKESAPDHDGSGRFLSISTR